MRSSYLLLEQLADRRFLIRDMVDVPGRHHRQPLAERTTIAVEDVRLLSCDGDLPV